MNEDAETIIDRCALTRAASPATRRLLASAGKVRLVVRSEVLVTFGQPAKAIVLLGAGNVRLYRSVGRVSGHRTAGDVVGDAALIAGAAYSESAVAMTNVEALFVDRDVVIALRDADHAFGAAALQHFADRCAAAEQLAAGLRNTVEERLSTFLLGAAKRWGIPERGGRTRIAARLTHAEIANVIGSTRETVTMTLGTWRRAGVVTLERRLIVILAPNKLEAWAREASTSP